MTHVILSKALLIIAKKATTHEPCDKTLTRMGMLGAFDQTSRRQKLGK